MHIVCLQCVDNGFHIGRRPSYSHTNKVPTAVIIIILWVCYWIRIGYLFRFYFLLYFSCVYHQLCTLCADCVACSLSWYEHVFGTSNNDACANTSKVLYRRTCSMCKNKLVFMYIRNRLHCLSIEIRLLLQWTAHRQRKISRVEGTCEKCSLDICKHICFGVSGFGFRDDRNGIRSKQKFHFW